MIKQIGLPLRGRPILLITRMITDRIGLYSVLLPLLIKKIIFIMNEHILLITMLTIKILSTINSLKKKKLFRRDNIYNSFRLKEKTLSFD